MRNLGLLMVGLSLTTLPAACSDSGSSGGGSGGSTRLVNVAGQGYGNPLGTSSAYGGSTALGGTSAVE
jgi:hypothetical protein